jgi:competence protein ComFB
MKLKNYQEDIVLRAIEIALEDQPDMLSDEEFVNDVAAYVLNRVPPRYVMSERGFLRLALEHSDEEAAGQSMANVIGMMMLVNRGVELVQSRRRGQPPHKKDADTTGDGRADELTLVHNYPQLIGRVVDAATGDPVYGATVQLYVDGKLAPSESGGWHNPYVTREKTQGHFSFWPESINDDEEELETEATIVVEHPEYGRAERIMRLQTSGTLAKTEIITGDQILSIAPIELEHSAQR